METKSWSWDREREQDLQVVENRLLCAYILIIQEQTSKILIKKKYKYWCPVSPELQWETCKKPLRGWKLLRLSTWHTHCLFFHCESLQRKSLAALFSLPSGSCWLGSRSPWILLSSRPSSLGLSLHSIYSNLGAFCWTCSRLSTHPLPQVFFCKAASWPITLGLFCCMGLSWLLQKFTFALHATSEDAHRSFSLACPSPSECHLCSPIY